MRNKIISVIFIGILAIGGFYILLIKEHRSTSVLENRDLATYEGYSWNAWRNSDFQENVEQTIADQFPRRNNMVKYHQNFEYTLHSLLHRFRNLMLVNGDHEEILITQVNEEINLLTIGESKHLVRRARQQNEETISGINENVEKLNRISEAYPETRFFGYFINSPDHSSVIYPKENLFDYEVVLKDLDFPVGYFQMNNPKELTDYFFRTDHHWNHKGSLKGYEEIIDLLFDEQEDPRSPTEIRCFDDIEFYGSLSRQTTFVTDVEPDDLCTFVFDLPSYQLYINGENADHYGNLKEYTEETVTEEVGFDHYNHLHQPREAVITFDSEENEGHKLLVISDSMSNPIRDLIASHFDQTVFINVDRYIDTYGDFYLERYMEEYEIDYVLYFLTISNLYPENELSKMQLTP